jgi:hypothetical protein
VFNLSGFSGQVVSALAFHLWGRRFKSQWELSQCDSNPVLMWKKKCKSQCSAENCGFSPGTTVSSHRESWQGGLGKKGPQ